jgi:hypothetical protein
MKVYHFSVLIRDARMDGEDLEDRLFAAGCDDALVCGYNQSVYLEFEREASCAELAIKSALDNIRTAGFFDLVVQESGVAALSEMAARAGLCPSMPSINVATAISLARFTAWRRVPRYIRGAR